MDDLELIKQKINIVDLIQEYLPLKKSGINFKANCPFHQEKTASFMVSPERGIFKCFGCNKGGDIFKFIMEKEGLDFPEALEVLAKRAGVTLKTQKSKIKDQRERLYEANQKAAQFFNYILTTHSHGKKALEYLKSRGVTDETITQFNLGYAPNSWESLSRFLSKKGFSKEEMTSAGLLIPSERGGYDRFRGRIIFPLINVKNQVVGFSGRILDIGEPKYLNTPTTAVFDKTHFLFGLNLAKSEIRSKNQAVLVEGMMDMVLSYQAGIKNVLAVQGTALTVEQVELVKKYADTILLCFDKDLAGDSAERRGIEIIEAANLNIKAVKVEGGKDPADMVSNDPNSWQKAINEAEPVYDYYLRSISTRYNLRTAEGNKRAAQEILPIWAKISDPLVFEHYLEKLSSIFSIDGQVLRREINRIKNNPKVSYDTLYSKERTSSLQKPNQPEIAKNNPKDRRELLEEYLLALLLKIPTTVTFIPKFPETIFQMESYRSIYVLYVVYLDEISFKGQDFKINEFIKNLPDELVSEVDRLYLAEIDDKLEVGKAWQDEVVRVVAWLKRVLIKASLEKLSAQIKNAQLFGKIEQIEVLNRRFRDLSLKLKNL